MYTTIDQPNQHATLAYRVNDFCRAIGIGRSTFYKMLERGDIKTVKVGGRRLVPAPEAARQLQTHH